MVGQEKTFIHLESKEKVSLLGMGETNENGEGFKWMWS